MGLFCTNAALDLIRSFDAVLFTTSDQEQEHKCKNTDSY